MNTWKNNNVLTRIKESYFLEEDTSREMTSGLPSDARPVGGTIFYIDETAEGKYEFFDIDGNLMENVQVGDRPHTYRVVKKGSKAKYYVYHDKIYSGLWTYYKKGRYAYDLLDTSEDIGSGKTNTEKAMANDLYITADAKGYPTIWYQLQQVRNDKVGGCDDWFVPSVDEFEELRKAVESGSVRGGIIAGSSYNTSVFKNKYLWSSSETSLLSAYAWDHEDQYWDGIGKTRGFSVLFTRAF